MTIHLSIRVTKEDSERTKEILRSIATLENQLFNVFFQYKVVNPSLTFNQFMHGVFGKEYKKYSLKGSDL